MDIKDTVKDVADKVEEAIENKVEVLEEDVEKKVEEVEKKVDTIGNTVKSAVKGQVKAKMMLVIAAAVVVIGVLVLLVANPFGWNFSLNFGGGLKIENTANVVEKVRAISELTTSCYYEEYVMQSTKDEVKEQKHLIGASTQKNIHHEIVFTVKGTVRAGFNLSKLNEKDLVIHGDTVDITLPAPEIFDVISNPSDYKIFEEEGKWSHEEIVAIQKDGKMRTLNNALQSGILAKANKNGQEHITNLFKTFGFNVVNVTLTEIPSLKPTAEEVVERPVEIEAPMEESESKVEKTVDPSAEETVEE
jgi:hypothetical protein